MQILLLPILYPIILFCRIFGFKLPEGVQIAIFETMHMSFIFDRVIGWKYPTDWDLAPVWKYVCAEEMILDCYITYLNLKGPNGHLILDQVDDFVLKIIQNKTTWKRVLVVSETTKNLNLLPPTNDPNCGYVLMKFTRN